MNINLQTLTNILDGKCSSDANTEVLSVSIDTRTITADSAYIAIVGEVFDGHDFIDEAVGKGASVVVAEKDIDTTVPVIVVDNTRQALARIAAYWRNQFDIPVIGITGSNGKTTVKEICRSILQEAGNVVATERNNNNDIGVPLTIFQINENTDFAVIEMGTNHKGEIHYLAKIVKPTIAAITNIGESHLEGFKTKEAVAEEKSDIFSFMTDSCRAVLPEDSDFFNYLEGKASPANIVTFSGNGNGDVKVSQVQNGRVQINNGRDNIEFDCEYKLLGNHNLTNLACAIAITGGLGLNHKTYIKGIEKVTPVTGRLEPVRVDNKLLIINDSYNANPSSVKQAINVLNGLDGYKVFVFGDMGELGEEANKYHREIGQYLNEKPIDLLMTIGDFSRETASCFTGLQKHFDKQEQIADEILSIDEENIVVLVKASRFMGLDKLVDNLKLKAA